MCLPIINQHDLKNGTQSISLKIPMSLHKCIVAYTYNKMEMLHKPLSINLFYVR